MKLGTLRDGSRDGRLVVVRRDQRAFIDAGHVAPNLQTALDHWDRAEAPLRSLGEELERGRVAPALDARQLMSPLPRAYEWIDASA